MQDSRYSGMGFNSNTTTEKRWDADIAWFEAKPNVWQQFRIVGPAFMVAQNWFTTTKGKKFALFSRSWDPFTRSFSKQDQDPIFQIFGNPFDSSDERIKGLAPRTTVLVEAFVRPTVGLASGGELRPMRLPSSVFKAIAKSMELNFITDANGQPMVDANGQPMVADPTDPDYGYDIMLNYNPSANGSEKYTVQPGSKSRLTDQERARMMTLTDWATIVKVPTENQVKEALSRNGYMSLATNNNFGMVSEVSNAQSVGLGHQPPLTMGAPAPQAFAPAPMAPAPAQAFAPAPAPMGAPAPMAPAPQAFAPAPAPAPMGAPAPMAPAPAPQAFAPAPAPAPVK